MSIGPVALRAPDITVVIPVKNRRCMLADLFNGLAAQTFPADRFEVIVLDNHSQEDIEGLVRGIAATSHFHLRYERMGEDRGPVPARNQGARLARGAIIAFVDSDCRPAPGWLEAGSKLFSEPEVALVSGPITYKPEQSATFFCKLTAETLGEHPTYTAANAFYRRATFVAFHGFDESLSVKDFLNRAVECADTDLAWRVKKAGYKNRFAQHALVFHEIEQQSVFNWLMDPTRLILLPMLVRRHPELSGHLLHWNFVFYRGTVWVYAGATVVLLILFTDWRLIWIPTLASLVMGVRRSRSLAPARVARALGEMGLHFTRMVIMTITLLIGSLRYRRLVL